MKSFKQFLFEDSETQTKNTEELKPSLQKIQFPSSSDTDWKKLYDQHMEELKKAYMSDYYSKNPTVKPIYTFEQHPVSEDEKKRKLEQFHNQTLEHLRRIARSADAVSFDFSPEKEEEDKRWIEYPRQDPFVQEVTGPDGKKYPTFNAYGWKLDPPIEWQNTGPAYARRSPRLNYRESLLNSGITGIGNVIQNTVGATGGNFYYGMDDPNKDFDPVRRLELYKDYQDKKDKEKLLHFNYSWTPFPKTMTDVEHDFSKKYRKQLDALSVDPNEAETRKQRLIDFDIANMFDEHGALKDIRYGGSTVVPYFTEDDVTPKRDNFAQVGSGIETESRLQEKDQENARYVANQFLDRGHIENDIDDKGLKGMGRRPSADELEVYRLKGTLPKDESREKYDRYLEIWDKIRHQVEFANNRFRRYNSIKDHPLMTRMFQDLKDVYDPNPPLGAIWYQGRPKLYDTLDDNIVWAENLPDLRGDGPDTDEQAKSLELNKKIQKLLIDKSLPKVRGPELGPEGQVWTSSLVGNTADLSSYGFYTPQYYHIPGHV